MPLEFALRPRFNLERPVPRRRTVQRRFLRLAVPIAAYWLAIAGVTHAFLRSAAEEPGPGDPLASDAELAATEAPTIPDVEGADEGATAPPEVPAPPAAPAANDDGPAAPRDVAAADTTELGSPALTTAPLTPAPPRAPAPRADLEPDFLPRRTLAAPEPAPSPQPRVARAEPRRSEPPLALFAPLVDEPATPRADVPAPAPKQESTKEEARAFALPSCEAAAASANDTIDMQGARGAPDLTRDAFAAVLENGSYLNRCEIPARTALDVCAAVQNGKVVGISVTSTPRSSHINACVRRAVVGLRFPSNARLDITRTRFEPAR